VEHVMKVFFGAHGSENVEQPRERRRRRRAAGHDPLSHPDDVICDEEVLESAAP
jgi:hypothetical protein